jgi:peptidyl-prolyl cis-trans isomerase SurA
MRLKKKTMKFINKLLALAFFIPFFSGAQPDTTALAQATAPQKRLKVDGIIATVGDYIVLDSDIDKTYLELSAQGANMEGISRCQLLGKLLEDKLYAHQAVQDSIIITDESVREKMDRQINYMVEQLGSLEKVVQYFKKASVEDFRSDLSEIIKTNMLTDEMRNKIIDEVEVTPEEVRQFFNRLPQEELPVFGAELEVAQIVIQPKISEEEKQRTINKLKEFREEILNKSSSFFTKAVLYSQDPGSKSNGGYYKMNRKTPFVKEFKEVAFSLNEGEISEPFETSFGYHIILVEKIRGQEIELRHILLSPRITESALAEAKERATTIRNRIVNNEISFAEAARSESDEKETKANGGALINPKTQDTRFELTKMDPSLYGQVSNLKDNNVSLPIAEEDPSGRKYYKLMMVTNRYDEHKADYAKDYTKIKELALKEKQIRRIGEWSNEKIKETFIRINGEYRDCDFANNWLKK